MLKINNLSVFYNKYKAVDNVSFNLYKGQKLSIIGPNGCGKTSLLKAISNTVCFEGEIQINNENIKNIKRKQLSKKIGMISQLTAINFDYTVFDVVMMGRYIYQNKWDFNNKKQHIDIVLNAIKTVGLLDYKDKNIYNLSGGQIQRVFLAKLIAQNPDIILLDEPTNHLDFKYQIELINFLKQWANDEQKTIIGVIHDINLAMLLSDDMIVMENGKIVCFDKCENILKTDILNNVYNIDIKKYMQNSFKKWL